MKKISSYLLRYLAAVGLVLAAAWLRWALIPYLGMTALYITVYPAIFFCVVFLGMGPGMVAGVIGIWVVETRLFLLAGPFMLSAEVLLRTAFILLSVFLIGLATIRLRGSLVRARVRNEELWQSRERYRALGEAVFDGVLVHDHGKILDVNDAFCRMTGYAREELLGNNFVEFLVTPDTRGTVLRHVELNLNDPYEISMTAKSGAHLDLEMRGKAVLFRGRTVRLAAVQDITERKKHEAALEQSRRLLLASEERYRSVLENSLDTAYRRNLQTGHYDYMSPSIQSILGYTPEDMDIMGPDGFMEHVHPDDRQRHEEEMQDSERMGAGRYEYRFRTRAGDYRWLADHVTVTRDASGQSLYRDGVLRDITDRKQAEEILRASEEQYRLIFDKSQDGIVLHELATEPSGGLFIQANETICRMLGYTLEEMRRLTPYDIQDDSPEVLRQEAEAMLRDGSLRFEKILRTKDGRKIQTEIQSTVFMREGRRLVLSVIRDISERKRAEEALRLVNQELAEADHRKDEFLAMLAHELRNPLAPIRNAVQILRMIQPEDGSLKRQRELIDRQVTHMARLLDDLLDVSRITRGKIVLRKRLVGMSEILGQAMETVQPLITSRNQILNTTPPPKDLYVDGDPDRLAQVVSNLLTNAAKYTLEGGQIWLSAAREGEQAVIRVRDNGMGIASNMLEDVFELFTQSSRGLDRSQGGLGIGLTIVRNLVEMHGGTVKAFSPGPGQGSEFVVRLAALAKAPESKNPPRVEAGRPGASHRVMVVEDVKDTADSLADLIRLWGHQVQTAYDGLEALKEFSIFQPDVVILDIGLPGLDGFTLAKKFHDENASLRIMAMSGYGQGTDRRQAAESGIQNYLVKPVDPAALQRLLAA